MKLTDELREHIEEYFNNISAEELYDVLTKRYAKMNAPAITRLYKPSHVSNLTLQSGFPPAMLPSVNFVELAKKNQSDR